MKIAYLILAHANPPQLGRLVERLQGTNAQCYIHIDANTDQATFTAMQAAAPHAQWAERQPCRWGGFSLVEATLRLMQMALADGCDWLVLLSAQDYPVKHPQTIANTLAHSPYAAHIDIQPDFDVRYRWQSWHLEALNGKPLGKALQKLQRISNHIGIKRSPPQPLARIQAGSQWWMLSASVVRTTLNFIESHPQVLRFFQTTLVPDEMLFQSILSHLLPTEKIGLSLRAIEWEAGNWSPKTFTETDAERLVGSDALFARKFAGDGIATAAIDTLLDPVIRK